MKVWSYLYNHHMDAKLGRMLTHIRPKITEIPLNAEHKLDDLEKRRLNSSVGRLQTVQVK